MPDRRIVLAGGTGFIGERLTGALTICGYSVTLLVRKPPERERAGVRFAVWDGRQSGPWEKELSGADVLINLVGETISQQWTPEARRRILESRLQSAGALCTAIGQISAPPKRWINASAIGFYGDRGTEPLDETAGPGRGFLAETCVRWEEALSECSAVKNKCAVRIGMVLGEGGALPTLRRLAQFGLGGTVGSGEQIVSWIHIDDLVRAFVFLCDRDPLPSVVNAVSPNPVTNRTLMTEVRRSARAPFGLPAPAFAVRAAGSLVGPDADLVLTGVNVVPAELNRAGFEFKFPGLTAALADLTDQPGKSR